MKGSFKRIAAVVILLLSVSCQNNSQRASENITKESKQIRMNLCSEPATMDPRKGGDPISSHMHFLLFEGLTRLNEDGSISFAQAESVDISPDGKQYTFHMRDTKWSNGDAVTAYDFEKSWKDILDPQFPAVNAHLLYPVKNAEAAKKGQVPLSEVGIAATDAKTLVVTLHQATPYFLDVIAFCVFFPVNKTIDESNPDWAYEAGERFVCNGPYHLTGWKHNNEIVAQRNLQYWEKEKVQPDSFHFSIIDNESTALQMFHNGEIDIIGSPLSPLPIDALPSLIQKGMVKKKATAGSTILAFNTIKFPFTNPDIRKAFALAINREEIVKNITQLNELVATNAIPPILKSNRVRQFFKDHDVETARKLLDRGLKELGVSREDLKEMTYYYAISDVNGKIAQAIQQQIFKALGIKVKLEGVEFKVLMDKLTKRDYLIGQTMWWAQYNDPMNIFERFKYKENAKNYSHWENPEFIKLLDQSGLESGDVRIATLEKAEEIFVNDMPVAPIFHYDLCYMVQPYLNDITLSPIGDIYFQDIDVAKKFSRLELIAEK
ncbi:MAG: peptide ABC transporter substrate-binding protein [Parachlamydiales bacterium]